MQWIDAHMHIGQDLDGVAASYEDVEYLFAEEWIDKGVVFPLNEEDGIDHGNERIREIVADDDRLAGLFRIDPDIHTPADLEETDGFAGFKMHPRAQDFSMQRVYHHLEVAGDLGKPVLVHTGVGEGEGFERAHPEDVLEAAAVHPDTDIILAHATKGYYYHAPDEFRHRFQDLDNAYIDTSLHMTPLGIERLVQELGADRVLFASDYPYGHPGPMKKNVEIATIPDQAADAIASKNAEELFF